MFTLQDKIFLAIATIFFVAMIYLAHYYLKSLDQDSHSKPLESSMEKELDL